MRDHPREQRSDTARTVSITFRQCCLSRARGGELPYKNDGGARWKMLKKTLKGARISFDGRGSNIFLLLRGANFKQYKTCSVIFFQFQTLRYRDNSNRGHFRFQHPKRYQSTHFDP